MTQKKIGGKKSTFICQKCGNTGQHSFKCCSTESQCLGTRARVPRKKASKRAWKKFEKYCKDTHNPYYYNTIIDFKFIRKK